jgi:hypothetical protein
MDQGVPEIVFRAPLFWHEQEYQYDCVVVTCAVCNGFVSKPVHEYFNAAPFCKWYPGLLAFCNVDLLWSYSHRCASLPLTRQGQINASFDGS